MKNSLFSLASLATAAASLLSSPQLHAGSVESAGKNVASQMRESAPFPFHFQLDSGYESKYIYRGINILPEANLNIGKVFAGLGAQNNLNVNDIKLANQSSIFYTDAAIIYSPSPAIGSFTLGSFYAVQVDPRVNFLGGPPLFNDYKELDFFGVYSHDFGPLSATLGGTWYHVRQASLFDTAELNFGLAYTLPQFPYITASFGYDYAVAYHYDGRLAVDNTGALRPGRETFFDGHYLEGKLQGNLFFAGKRAEFRPYVLLSASAGIAPRAFDNQSVTYLRGRFLTNSLIQAGNANVTGFDPEALDRGLELNNFQTGFKLPIFLTRHITLTGEFSYSTPLHNLKVSPYNQRDETWGGVNLNLFF